MRSPRCSNDSITLPGIARHISEVLSQNFVGDHSLTERNSAVVGRHRTVEIHRESLSLECIHRSLQQIHVLKRSSAQANAIQFVNLSDSATDGQNDFSQRVVEPGRDLSLRLGCKFLHDFANHRTEIYLANFFASDLV